MIWRALAGVILVIALVFGAFLVWSWKGEISAQKAPAATSFDPGQVAKGSQLAAIGNCGSCHTQPGGKPYAGGLPIKTPFGTIYGTNITPDVDTGIGNWSEAAFRRAMREGVDRKGSHLYPAFPFDHFTHVSDSDISALYAFLMAREPVRQENRALGLPFPLNIRMAAAAWKLLFLRQATIPHVSAQSEEWNRGAYLVAGLGHCGACHTPRNAFGAEKTHESFAGGEGEGWHAPALDESSPAPIAWSADQVYAYLRNGFADQHGYAAGPMKAVVRNLSRASDADVRAISVYVAGLSGSSKSGEVEQKATDVFEFARSREASIPYSNDSSATTGTGAADVGQRHSGADIFNGACAGCHHSGGELPISRPAPLGLSSTLNAPDATDLIRLVLDGIHPQPEERGAIMPGFNGALTDDQIIALVNYLRGRFTRRPEWADVGSMLARVRRDDKD